MNKHEKKKELEICNWLLKKKGYLKCSPKRILSVLNSNYGSRGVFTLPDIQSGLKLAKNSLKWQKVGYEKVSPRVVSKVYEAKGPQKEWSKDGLNPDNVIFIADLHAPWILDGYLDWVKSQQIKYNCGTVIFSGDIIDSGAWSYHEHDPDGLGVKDELHAAKKQLKKVFEMFPEAICLMGNHDLLISRKAKTAGLSQEFIKDFGQILDAPETWKFVHEHIRDNVRYIHGSTGDAFGRAKESRMSTCQGHLHSKTFVQWSVSEKDAIFGLQVGGGFDRNKYAFDYAKPFPKKPIVSCGFILENGKIPFTTLMPL